MANARDVIELFLTTNVDRAQELADQLDVFNRERQKVESEIVEQITAECEGLVEEQIGAALVFSGAGWHPGVLGIVASRLVERFCRPVFVLSDVAGTAQGESGMLSGSGRSIAAFHLLEALESMPGLFSRFGGHKQAAGLTLAAENLSEFRRRFAEFAGVVLTVEDFRPMYMVDASTHFSDLSDGCIRQIQSLGPFGFGNPQPTLLASRATVAGPPRVLREGKHYSVPLRSGGRLLWCKAWNFGDRAEQLRPGTCLDVLFQVEDDAMSRKRGYDPWCVTLKDIREAQ
jgi:single-stranded-DNA-specific exonuclease